MEMNSVLASGTRDSIAKTLRIPCRISQYISGNADNASQGVDRILKRAQHVLIKVTTLFRVLPVHQVLSFGGGLKNDFVVD